MTFHYRIFIVFVFDKISKGMLVTIEKEPSEYFQQLHFWNQWVPLIKMHCRVRYLFDFDLKVRSGQVWKQNNNVCLFWQSKLNATKVSIKTRSNKNWPKYAQICPNLKFCFKKRAHLRTLLVGLWEPHSTGSPCLEKGHRVATSINVKILLEFGVVSFNTNDNCKTSKND